MGSDDRARGWRRAFAVGTVAIAAAAPLGWVVTDHLEQDDDFCNACHLEPEVPLHIAIRRDFDAGAPATLAAVHGSARVDARADSDFRCIDCHGGHGFASRARVKVLAGLDGLYYLTGQFEEPDHMAWPLLDGDCRHCHATLGETAAADIPDWESQRFHQIPLHNVDLGVDCVECHLVHEVGGNADNYFLHANQVRSQCARCHVEYQVASAPLRAADPMTSRRISR